MNDKDPKKPSEEEIKKLIEQLKKNNSTKKYSSKLWIFIA